MMKTKQKKLDQFQTIYDINNFIILIIQVSFKI